MNCPNCQTPNAPGDQFCIACGNELAGAAPSPATSDTSAVQPATNTAPVSTGPAIATLTHGGTNIPLYEGSKVVIARKDTDKCTPDLAIDSDKVSGTPVEVTVENGEVKVRDTGTSVGTRVVVYLKPGDSMPLKPGDMLMLGDQVVSVG